MWDMMEWLIEVQLCTLYVRYLAQEGIDVGQNYGNRVVVGERG
jgi:NAD-specific glutamate dehydrogenase